MSVKLIGQTIQCLALAMIALVVNAQQSEPERQGAQPQTGNLTGRVIGERGQPLAGATVFVRRLNVVGGTGRQVTTNDEGYFEARNLDAGLYSVVPNAPAYVMAPRDPDTPAAIYRIGDSVRLELIRGGVITGTITNAANEPVIAVRVRALMIRDANAQEMKGLLPSFGFTTTDDRGVYRIYGLVPGTYIVESGSIRSSGSSVTPYDLDGSTFAPSSNRDTAAELSVSAGQEVTADIRYRGEPGHIVSGTVLNVGANGANISLTPANGGWLASSSTFQNPGVRGFAFYGVADGVYDVVAQQGIALAAGQASDIAFSEAKRITVKGGDVTGLELTTKPLASISGTIALQPSTAPQCAGKRQPNLAETMVTIQRNRTNDPGVSLALQRTAAFAAPDKNGSLEWKNLVSGQHAVTPRFFARYWYLQSITLTTVAAASAKSALSNQKIDVARNWITLKSGDRLTGLTITLAEGAGSVRGRLAVTEGDLVPSNLNVFLVPAEREKADDVLRYFAVEVAADQTFSVDNLPPGRYWLIAQPRFPRDKPGSNLRLPDAAEVRTKLRMRAEAGKNEIELKSCQNLSDFRLRFSAQ